MNARAAAATAASKLADEGHLVRVWKRPLPTDETSVLSLYRAANSTISALLAKLTKLGATIKPLRSVTDAARHENMAILQVMRGIAALSVVVFHCHVILNLPEYGGMNVLGGVSCFGWLGVNFFFALSGYVLTRSFERHLARPSSQILARVIRLGLPALAATIVAAAVMSAFGKLNVPAGLLSGSEWFAAHFKAWPTRIATALSTVT